MTTYALKAECVSWVVARLKTDLVCVLVVEDEPLIRMSVVDELDFAGFRVLEAASANEAMDVLASNPDIRVLFTDIDMPGEMNGLDLAEAALCQKHDLGILLTSGYLKVPRNGLPTNTSYIAKPYDMDLVLSNIREMTHHSA